MSGLGDFLLTLVPGQREGAGMLTGFDAPSAWPEIGSARGEVRTLALWPGAVLRVHGGGELRQRGQSGAFWLTVSSVHAAPLALAIDQWLEQGTFSTSGLGGRFVVLLWDAARREWHGFTDAFRSFPLAWEARGERLIAASDLRLLRGASDALAAMHDEAALSVDWQAAYHYLNFSFVPNESCIWSGVRKLGPASRLSVTPAGITQERYWDPSYPADLAGSDRQMAGALRERIVATVQGYGHGEPGSFGAFVSGGTDSSSIAGILARQLRERSGQALRSFSIGFAEPGYDELGFARCARDAFGLAAHERIVSEADAVAAVPRLLRAYDEPYGNASAIPTHYCAMLAAEHGVHLLVGGDGGDEIFGGNERYLKDRIFSLFHSAPPALRGIGGSLASALAVFDSRWPNKARNFVRRANLPNPDRFYSDDAFASEHFDTLPGARLRAAVERDDSLELQRRLYADCTAASELHRLMYLDLKMTIAANDIVKVTRAARIAGVDTAFPFLEPALVDYTGRLPVRYKLRGTDKRYLFKQAMMDILPRQIRTKKKQGFGLPVSVWMRRDGPLDDLVNDTLRSQTARSRGLIETSAIEGLLERHRRGAWDHAAELYMLMMLELWLLGSKDVS